MSDKMIRFTNVRLSFPHLVTPQVQENGSSYSADFLMPPNHPDFQKFMGLVGELANEKWKEHAGTILGIINTESKNRCYGRGDEKINKKSLKPYDGYAGNVHVSAKRKSDSAPQVFQEDGSQVPPDNTMAYQQLTRAMYGGCRVNVALKPWIQDNKHGRAVRCELIGIQFAGDDTPFGEGSADASGLFGAAPQVTPTWAAQPAPVATGLPSFFG